MKYCVIDLEATCWDRNDPNLQPHEIIEIGAILLDENYEYINEFDQFIKPRNNPILSEYCKDLTSITQNDTDNAPTLKAAIIKLTEWLGSSENVIFCSWGYFDKDQLLKECDAHMIDYPFNTDHINIKEQFSKIMERTKKMGLQKALRILNIPFNGTPHRGIDDAKMIAKVFKIIMQKK